jgi:RNA recognition motif-containing protein
LEIKVITLSVRGLPREMTESALTDLFALHGKVHGLRLAKDLFSGACKGFAELKMEGHEARAAIAALDGSSHGGSLVRVGLASERRPNGRR